jgi:hypothetical protein
MFGLVVFCFMGLSAVLGVLIFLKPEATIRFQQKFYASINWRMEPISMEKEIRNTRILGMFLVAMSLLGILGRIYLPVLVNVGYEMKCYL